MAFAHDLLKPRFSTCYFMFRVEQFLSKICEQKPAETAVVMDRVGRTTGANHVNLATLLSGPLCHAKDWDQRGPAWLQSTYLDGTSARAK